jgi:hypothetical protein
VSLVVADYGLHVVSPVFHGLARSKWPQLFRVPFIDGKYRDVPAEGTVTENPTLRVVYIGAASRSVSQVEIEPSNGELSRLCETPRPKAVVTLPNGDLLLAAEGNPSAAGFSIGGSAIFRSNGVLLGKRDRWRQYTSPRSGQDRVAALVRWVEASSADAAASESVQAILIDPARRTIERVNIRQSLTAIEELIGEEIVLAFRAPGGDRVYAAVEAQGAKWRKDDADFVGRCVIVGTFQGGLVDAAASLEKIRKDVRFAAERSKRWARYRDLARP